MLVSDLITILQDVQKEHGDLQVFGCESVLPLSRVTVGEEDIEDGDPTTLNAYLEFTSE
jgi:hypothetical protein